MKVLAINGSPKMDEGNTARILNPFLDGMRDAGADVELFHTRKLKIGPCNGDMSCWFRNPGRCGQKDDMQMLYPKFEDADVIVWATPVYFSGVTGPLKNLMDRQLPLHVPGTVAKKRQKVVLVSSCGAWEMAAFDPIIAQMKAIYSRPDAEFVAALLRPGAEAMRFMPEGAMDDVIQAARDAGRELVRTGRISESLLKAVSRPLMSEEEYMRLGEKAIEEARKGA
ncbi:MAG: flavodoxin family protein [Methanothrix sp.]|uniref:flavodoxin family protein n=1 Tax=Methanothrix sp. TaxID=90426 RepID=UPI0025DFA5E8|nr:flavodoxin family protein [Methanothrix sp.]MCQ8903869.1 flavodoxin family protein [Methanothrix sp.]